MVEIILFYIKTNIKSYSIAMVLLSLLFVLCGISYESFLTNQTLLSYTESLKDSVWIYPAVFFEEIQQEQMQMGRACQEIVTLEEENYACIYMNEFLFKSFIKKVEGKGFSYADATNEIILYGDSLNSQYEIGDTLLLNGTEYSVVGKIPTYMPIWNLFYYSEDIVEAEDVYMHALNGDMCFVNNMNAFKGERMVYSDTFCSQKADMRKDGISIMRIKEILLPELKANQVFDKTAIILFFCLNGYFCLLLSVIQQKRNHKLFGVLLLSGMSRMKYYLFLLMNTSVVIGGATALYISCRLFQSALFETKEYTDERFFAGQQNIVLCLCGMIFVILFVFHLLEYRSSVSKLLSENME